MIVRKKKICKGCGEEEYLWAHGKCKRCASKEPKKAKAKKPVIPQATGELALFQAIWNNRPHICSVCKTNLKDFSVWFFSHILSKGAFPKFRLYDKNIVLKCANCHHLWETQPNEKLLHDNPSWEPIIELHDNLVTEYYKKSPASESIEDIYDELEDEKQG